MQTYVERDIRRMANIADLGQFGRFLRLCGALTGQEICTSRNWGVSWSKPQNCAFMIDLLAGSYQWLELPAYSSNRIKRLADAQKAYYRLRYRLLPQWSAHSGEYTE